jgi:hypothetical protein
MNEFISDSHAAAFRARIRLFSFARGTTLIEIAVYIFMYFSLYLEDSTYWTMS